MNDYTIVKNNFANYYNERGLTKAHQIADRILVRNWLDSKIDKFSAIDYEDRHRVPVIDKDGNKDMEVTFTIRKELTGEEFDVTVTFTAFMDYDYNVWTETGERDHYNVEDMWFKDIDNVRLSSEHMLNVDEKAMILDMFAGFIKKRFSRWDIKA